ncbi:MAG: lipopolysaccharide kinase InaA family protein [Methylophilus sp.]
MMSPHLHQFLQIIHQSMGYILMGGLRVRKGHFPTLLHDVPANFIGVCVASNENPAVDDYVVKQLQTLGLKRVRLDFTDGDLDSYNARFLKRLIAENFEISLHLIQPFESAKNMHLEEEQQKWRVFLQHVLDIYGSQIKEIEIGNTINRKRWAGYHLLGFIKAWSIAHEETRRRGITMIGPNIQDFEPLYNISLLKELKRLNLLPDIHSNNLFVERVTEPERFDHRIFKYRWARWFKYNLIKKSRILNKISHDFGVRHLVSPVAFWAIYRIQRLLPDGQQKQADYAARYFLLLAASGALLHANWGALICQREGLIDDGLSEAEYPDLERVTHYKSADGLVKNYLQYPSFNAIKTVAKLIQGAQYVKPIETANGLEIHYFIQGNQHIHAAWTINAKVAFASEVYEKDTLAQAKIFNRDGQPLTQLELITESPVYLIWEAAEQISIQSKLHLADGLSLHAHMHEQQHYKFEHNGWQGLVLAKDEQEAELLKRTLHPDNLIQPSKAGALRHARNAIWAIADPRDEGNLRQLTVKQPVKMHLHKAYLDRLKPSKAKRSWNGAMELLRRGIATAQPLAYFEKLGDTSLKQNFYICEYVKSDFNIGQAFSTFAKGDSQYLAFSAEQIYMQFAQFCHLMHSRGIYFRDFSGGNILVSIEANQQLAFSLIDTARLHAFNHPTKPNLRISDLTRALNKLHWVGRIRFMQIYLGMTGRQFAWRQRIPFYIYDFKVDMKRKIGRKAWKKLMKRIQSKS